MRGRGWRRPRGGWWRRSLALALIRVLALVAGVVLGADDGGDLDAEAVAAELGVGVDVVVPAGGGAGGDLGAVVAGPRAQRCPDAGVVGRGEVEADLRR